MSGVIQDKATYEIESTRMHRYGTYLSKDSDLASNYKIKVPLKHILSVLRICDLQPDSAEFSCAMEVVDIETAMCFFFTKTRDFSFLIGVGSVGFENLDGKLIDSDKIAAVISKPVGQNRLKRA